MKITLPKAMLNQKKTREREMTILEYFKHLEYQRNIYDRTHKLLNKIDAFGDLRKCGFCGHWSDDYTVDKDVGDIECGFCARKRESGLK